MKLSVKNSRQKHRTNQSVSLFDAVAYMFVHLRRYHIDVYGTIYRYYFSLPFSKKMPIAEVFSRNSCETFVYELFSMTHWFEIDTMAMCLLQQQPTDVQYQVANNSDYPSSNPIYIYIYIIVIKYSYTWQNEFFLCFIDSKYKINIYNIKLFIVYFKDFKILTLFSQFLFYVLFKWQLIELTICYSISFIDCFNISLMLSHCIW